MILILVAILAVWLGMIVLLCLPGKAIKFRDKQ